MSSWYPLGVELRVPVAVLQQIESRSPQGGIVRWRIDLLQHWLDSTPTASWCDIITALENTGHNALSTRLRSRYSRQQTTGNISRKYYKNHTQKDIFLSKALCNNCIRIHRIAINFVIRVIKD